MDHPYSQILRAYHGRFGCHYYLHQRLRRHHRPDRQRLEESGTPMQPPRHR